MIQGSQVGVRSLFIIIGWCSFCSSCSTGTVFGELWNREEEAGLRCSKGEREKEGRKEEDRNRFALVIDPIRPPSFLLQAILTWGNCLPPFSLSSSLSLSFIFLSSLILSLSLSLSHKHTLFFLSLNYTLHTHTNTHTYESIYTCLHELF